MIASPPAPFLTFKGNQRFTPTALLGRGAMGVVYRAQDKETESEVALKTLEHVDPDHLYMLKQEFRALTGITHPNLVELYELFVDGESGFFTMELVSGGNFLEYVRPAMAASGGLAELLDVSRQLVAGLAALHEAGKLHRDVKPSNIMVTPQGQTILLDFGLATAFGWDARRDQDSEIAGSLGYMAPEQIWRQTPGPASDWYSVGAILFEALTGDAAFKGNAARMAQDKTYGPVPSVRTLAPHIPEEIAALVAALLNPAPETRPDAIEILRALGGGRTLSIGSIERAYASAEKTPFVGREAESAHLMAAFDNLVNGRPIIVHVHGPSGIGKSELIRRFLRSTEDERGALVLRGRCHPHEAVPYKGLDTLVDELSRWLTTLPDNDAAAFVPENAAALIRLFPVLARCPAFAPFEQKLATTEPHEIRRRAFAALRDLLARAAARQPLVLWIDDLQWSDLDSAALMREVLRPPDAPPLLLVLSYRSEDREQILAVAERSEALQQVDSESLSLAPLDFDKSLELAKLLCSAEVSSEHRIAEIIGETAGNPFFIGELARAFSAGQTPHLVDVIGARVQKLPDPARRLLEILSIAGGPLTRTVALTAAGIGERGRPIVTNLERRSLLRTTAARGDVGVEIYHDRIRETLAAELPPDTVRSRHGELADVLERAPEPDAEALYRHSLGAGRRPQAAKWAMAAGDEAAHTLAFARAAALYRAALDLCEDEGTRASLLAKLAEALANVGRGSEAADIFEKAAQAHTTQAAEHSSVLDLRRRAAEQYLRSGHLDDGLRVTRDVLQQVGVGFPETPGRTLLSLLWLRTRLALRGLRFRPRRLDEVPRDTLLRLDVCHGAAMSLGSLDPLLADVLGVRHLLEALHSGEKSHIAQTVAWEAIKSVQMGGRFLRRRSGRLLELVERLAEETGDPYDQVGLHFSTGAAHYEAGEWRQAHERCEQAGRLARERCTGLAFERATIDAFSFSALAHMGELGELARRLPAAITDADDRGDRYASLGFRAGVLGLAWLAQDQPLQGRRNLDDAIRHWPTRTFLLQHYLHLIAAVHADLYVGDVWAAWRRLQDTWPKLRGALYLAMESPRVEVRNLRARAALAAAATTQLPEGATAPDPTWPRERLLREAAQEARRVRRATSNASSAGFAALIDAGIADIEGRDDDAVRSYTTAASHLERAEMRLYRFAALRRKGELLRGDQGAFLRQLSEQWMREQEVQVADSMTRVLAPAPER